MKRSTLLTIVALMFLACQHGRAQFAIDTARGLVGGKVDVVLRAPAGDLERRGVVRLDATMQLSNPTVFYPERFIAPAGDSVLGFTLMAVKDSIYNVSITLRRDPANTAAGDTVVTLRGEALAGSDSVCIIALRSVLADGAPIAESRGVVITRSIGPPLPYVRFAILEQNYPNPVPRGSSTTWAYRIDKRSDVRFHFFNLLGQELFVALLGDQPIGPHVYVYTPPLDMPSGVYLVRLVTNSGSADKVMHMLR